MTAAPDGSFASQGIVFTVGSTYDLSVQWTADGTTTSEGLEMCIRDRFNLVHFSGKLLFDTLAYRYMVGIYDIPQEVNALIHWAQDVYKRQRLTRSNYIFSGMKTFHELNEAFPSVLAENGNKKTFERFLNDVRKIDETYNSN